MVESSEIQQLREDVQELRLLYRRLAETLLPEEEPTPEEKAALDDESREYFSESEFLRMLQGDVRRSSKRSASRVRMAERYVDRVVVCDDGSRDLTGAIAETTCFYVSR
jgi:uncharacterized protein involved in exopolysaccharide biosynthesis